MQNSIAIKMQMHGILLREEGGEPPIGEKNRRSVEAAVEVAGDATQVAHELKEALLSLVARSMVAQGKSDEDVARALGVNVCLVEGLMVEVRGTA